MSAPVGRLAFLLGRWLGFSLASLGIVVLGRPLATRLTVSPLALAGPFVSMLGLVHWLVENGGPVFPAEELETGGRSRPPWQKQSAG